VSLAKSRMPAARVASGCYKSILPSGCRIKVGVTRPRQCGSFEVPVDSSRQLHQVVSSIPSPPVHYPKIYISSWLAFRSLFSVVLGITLSFYQSTNCKRRLIRDFKRLSTDPPSGISGSPCPDNIMLWNAVIFGPGQSYPALLA
jgi:hypothetical protein